MPKIIAIVPVFNEEKTLEDILRRISLRVDFLVCVNDGSSDNSLKILREFARSRKNIFIVDLISNTGMAGAIRQGFLFAMYLEMMRKVNREDLVVTIDADGQHRPEYIPALVKYLLLKNVDVVLTRRDFSVYPKYKIWGNRFLTWTNSGLSGFKYHDVESGFRLLKVKTIKLILKYYTGMKYSCAQEIALISAREGFKIDNDFKVEIAYYRSGTTILDGFVVLFLSLVTYFRWFFKITVNISCDQPIFREAFNESVKYWPLSSKRRMK